MKQFTENGAPNPLLTDMQRLQTSAEREIYLSTKNKRLFAEALRVTKRFDEREFQMKKMAEDPEYMSIYITDYLEPLLFKMRSQGKLKIGKKKLGMSIGDSILEYEGEIDEQGLATGIGRATCDSGIIQGTFYKDDLAGLMTWIDEKSKRFEEYKEPLHHKNKDGTSDLSEKHGKVTTYLNDGRIFNMLYRNKELVG